MENYIVEDFSVNKLNEVRSSIEKMNKFNQIEVLRILKKLSTTVLNENNYGIHINLTELPAQVIHELIIYINYVNTQESTLHEFEKEKEVCKNVYFTKDNKDNGTKR
jgi:hypothetical protein